MDSYVDQWELDQCRYCKGPIDDPTEAYCSSSCELKWMQQQGEPAENSPTSSSVFSAHGEQSIHSSPRSTPASSASSSPEFGPILPSGSVPNLPLESSYPLTVNERRYSYNMRSYKYGSSHNPIKKTFPSNYYQSTIGDRSGIQPIFADKSVSLGIRKTSIDDIRSKPTLSRAEKRSSTIDTSNPNTKEPPSPTVNNRSLWSWRRFSTLT